MVNVDEILKKYGGKISQEIESDAKVGDISREYITFKNDMMPALSKFEKFCKNFGSLFNIKLAKKDEEKLQKNLDIAHLDITPSNVVVFSFFAAFILFFTGLLLFVTFFYYLQAGDILVYSTGPAGLFLILTLIAAGFIFYYIYSTPERLAKTWRLKASAQMVPCILYIVLYMKHTSNLERAIVFASKHVHYPLGLDLKKIFWDVETGRYSTIKESLDNYLKLWESEALEFVEAVHLIESSLYEPSESRRIQILEKSLQTILDGVYEKMLVFSREIRSPLTNLYMLGVVLPTLGLALLPLASAMLGGTLKAYHIFVLFNLIVPFGVFYLTTQIMLKRPGGYGDTEILEMNPDYSTYISKKPYLISSFIAFPLILIGLLPIFFQWTWFLDIFGLPLGFDIDLGTLGIPFLEGIKFFGYEILDNRIIGPFGLGSLILSLFIPLGISLFFSIAFKLRTKELIKSKDYAKQLEGEFVNSLFQLGNRLGDGLPAEVAFARVADSTRGQRTENFFKKVNMNIQQAGMSLEAAIFDKRRGAILSYPSALIATSMRLLLESVKKGLQIAAQSLMSISDYIKNIQKVTQRLSDLLAEVVSDMKSNMVFLAPLLSGVVVGLTGMIALILLKLSSLLSIGSTNDLGGVDIATIMNIFDIKEMIPPYYMQISVGIYIVQIVFILSSVLTIIDSGDDKLKKTNDTGKNLSRGLTVYFIIALLAVLLLSILASVALGNLTI
ncbi:MAG TPA: hypothetical protein P5277_03765 [Candidatus Paceibacterota bacterium]|nr:hypothetical protein [Candidatus Paceibacterota bacterium]